MTELENETETRWVKHHSNSFASILGKEIVVLSSGNFITFVDSFRPDKKEVLYNANSEVRGDGIKCICTHKFLQFFAFAERCRNPRILVVSYPTFEVFKHFQSVTSTDYVALTFSEMEFLVALTGIPEYKIVIWNWRTGEKLYCQETEFHGPNQILRVSPTSPVQIIQWNFNEKQLLFWDMRLCYKKTLLHRTPVPLPETVQTPCSFIYGADGDVYFVDFYGSLYSINSETHICSQQYSITGYTTPTTAKFIPCVTWYKGGIVFTTPAEVLFLRRRSPEGWAKIWSFAPKIPFRCLMSSSVKDLLVGLSMTNEVIILKGDAQIESVTIRNFGADFEFVCFVNPVGDFFVTFGNSTNNFVLWNKLNGQKVSQLSWKNEKIKALESNPKWPYLVAATVDGSTYVINAYDQNCLTELENISLSLNSLDAIRFRGNQGNQFCVANMEVGEFFLLKIPSKLEVVAYVKVDLKIVDYAIPEKESNILLIVPMSQMCCRSGQTVLLYVLNEKKKNFDYLKDVRVPMVITSFISSPVSSKEIICIPHRSRKFCIINISTGKVVSEYVSGHQMKFISMRTDGEYLFTFGIDGLVIVKLVETKKCATIFGSHHRLLKGVERFTIDPYANFVVTVGNNGTMICTQFMKFGRIDRRPELEALMSSPAYKQLLQVSAPKTETKPKGSEKPAPQVLQQQKPPWVVLREQEMMNIQEQQNKKEKQNIWEEFLTIKRKLCQLLDENFSNFPERQLPVQAFDLDKAIRRKNIEDARIEREKAKQFQLASMKSFAKITEVIKSVCWDSVPVKGREIRGIATPLSVQSYALLPSEKSFETKLSWLTQKHKLRQLFKTGNFFDPWIPRTASELEQHLNTTFKVPLIDVTQTIKTKYEEHMEDEKTKTETEDQESKHVWSGTSSHNFIEVDPKHFSQFELMTFHQYHQEIFFIQNDMKKLMLWFNKNFEQTFEQKRQEMKFIRERNNRLRHIISELSFFNFSPHICQTVVHDPEWAPGENPETIMTVLDDEIKVPKYISTSEMELIKKKEAEDERLRKLMMSDDFKEKALITMMDGVLEKLWEEELKKDISKPKCMIEKEPEAYTEDDLKAIKAYQDAVKFLRIERERYRKILEGDWVRTNGAVRDSIIKFDEKLAKLHILKLKVESAIGQEVLKALRIRLNCHENICLERKKESLKTSILKNEIKMESMTGELNKLVEMLNECKNYYETLQNKDRNMDKNFKKEFPDYSPIICEQLYKLSKKRPKLLQKAAMYPTILIDLGKCAVAGTKPEYMPIECIQYLKDIDALDAYSNAPASTGQQTWELACRLRRLKIETELRIRACAIDLADAEATVASFQKSLKAAREYHSQLQNDLQAVRQEKTNGFLNYQIQLVLKKGLVEIPLTGRISDFDECILVTKDTLNEVNRAIQKIGEQKLKAMNKAANFRKGIIYKEWEHKKLRMEIEDLKGQLDTVEKLQVLKELQAILVARARGFTDDKGFLYQENELAKIKEKFQVTQTDIFNKMDELDAKIDKLNVDNQQLDMKIVELNVEVNEMNLSRDKDFDKKNLEEIMKRMKKVRERSRLVRQIQEQHNEMLVLQTELELLRLKTYPAIKYKIS